MPRRRGRRLPRRRRFRLQLATRPNQRWSLDFRSDQLANGRRFRVLNIVADYPREGKGQIVDFSISGLRLSLLLGGCGERIQDRVLRTDSLGSPLPQEIVLDNGPELTSEARFLWSEQAGVRSRFIDPGKPIQNALVESCPVPGHLSQRVLVHQFGSRSADDGILAPALPSRAASQCFTVPDSGGGAARMGGGLGERRLLGSLGKLFEFPTFPQARRR